MPSLGTLPQQYDFQLNQRSSQARGLVLWLPSSRGILRNRSKGSIPALTFGGNATITNTIMGRALDFDGTDDYVTITKLPIIDFSTGSFSAACWFYARAASENRLINDRGRGGSYQGWQWKIANSGAGWIYSDSAVSDGTHYNFQGADSTVKPFNTWGFGAMVYDSTSGAQTIKVYWNLVLNNTASFSGVGSITNTLPVELGATNYLNGSGSTTEQEFNGQILDMRLYNRILTLDDLTQMYTPDTRWELYEPIIPIVYSIRKQAASSYSVVVDGSITPTGDNVKKANKILAGSITSTGDDIKKANKIFSGSVTASSEMLKMAKKIFDASITPSGILVKQPKKVLDGSITSAGALQRDTSKVLTGSITPSADVLKSTSKIFTGSITPTGDNIKTPTKIFSGSITGAGELVKTPIKVLSGSITASGVLLRNIYKVLSGSVTPTGDNTKTTTKVLGGSITPSSDLSTFEIFLVVLSGSITAIGEIIKSTTKILSGTTTPSGDNIKTTTKVLEGSITPSGVLSTIKTYLLTLAGSITASGGLVKTTTKIFSGSITPSGDFLKTPMKILSGSITATGNALKSTTKILSGNVQALGELVKTPKKVLSGSITLSGALVKTPIKVLSGAITLSGELVKNTMKVLSGSITPSGSLIKSTKKILVGLIASSGDLTSAVVGEFVMIPGQTARLRYRVQDYQNFWEIYVRRNDSNNAWDFYADKMEAGVRSNQFFAADVGTPNSLRVICDGDVHVCYTLEAGIYTPQIIFSDAFLATETDTNTLYSSVIIPVYHTGYSRRSSSYNVLDRE